MKFPRAIRLDSSDLNVFDRAAEPGDDVRDLDPEAREGLVLSGHLDVVPADEAAAPGGVDPRRDGTAIGGTLQLFADNPDLIYYSIPYPEMNISTPGFGSLTMDVAAWRQMPGKHILFGFGVKKESDIPKVLRDYKTAGELTSCGIPQAAEFMMRMLEREGFTHEVMFFNSKLTYHFDCFMAQMKKGVVGLPDLPDYGIIGGGLPECLKDYEIVRMPVEDIHNGCANQINLGDGRSIVVRTAKETMKRMKKAGVECEVLLFEGKPHGFFNHPGFKKNADTETIELKLSEAALKEMPRLTKGLLFIKVISVVAPLMGLLGTVTGMIKTFQVITLYGAGDPKMMAGGISQALMTTVLGLVVAIPMVLLHTIVSGQSRKEAFPSRRLVLTGP